jgi:hypothetical protein
MVDPSILVGSFFVTVAPSLEPFVMVNCELDSHLFLLHNPRLLAKSMFRLQGKKGRGATADFPACTRDESIFG